VEESNFRPECFSCFEALGGCIAWRGNSANCIWGATIPAG